VDGKKGRTTVKNAVYHFTKICEPVVDLTGEQLSDLD
jgi:hypothetical protein